jgi:predicted nucleotidyltransferase
MTLVERIAALPDLAGARFLLIGGHAVNALGRTRSTLDWDFMVAKTEFDHWKRALGTLGYSLWHLASAFAQFKEPPDLPPVDLMMVDDMTFEKMFSASRVIEVGGVEIRVPCAPHLVALKLHAAASIYREDRSKDMEDIYAIVRRNNLSTDDPAFRELVEKYGGDSAVRLIREHERD